MDFVNESPFQAELVRSALASDDSEPMLAVVILKVTYEVLPDNSLELAEEQLPIRKEPEETELGSLPMDTAPTKPAFDVFVLGHVCAPKEQSLSQTRVRLRVGREVRELSIFGNRRWVRDNKKLVTSFPEQFKKLALSYAHAYGGRAKALAYEIPNPFNPAGKGYVLQEEHAEGVSLPNVEDPDSIIRTWEDQPVPAGFAPVPLSSMFTVERGVEYRKEKNEQRIRPEVFQSAHPKLVFPDLPPGTEVVLEGMNPDSPLIFQFPDLRARVSVQLEDNIYYPSGKPDTLCIMADERRFYIIHRTPFKYRFVPEQVRITRLSVDSHGVL